MPMRHSSPRTIASICVSPRRPTTTTRSSRTPRIAIWDGDENVTVYDTSQFTAGTANSLAGYFRIEERKRARDLALSSAEVSAAKAVSGPITSSACWPPATWAGLCDLRLSREGVFRIVGGRTPSQQRVAIARG